MSEYKKIALLVLASLLIWGKGWAFSERRPPSKDCDETFKRAYHYEIYSAYHACRAANLLERIATEMEKNKS